MSIVCGMIYFNVGGGCMFNSDQVINNLNGLTGRKRELFKEILIITKEQKEDIETNEAKNIEALVEKKQIVIDKVNEIDTAFASQYELLKSGLGIKSLENVDINKYPSLKLLKENVKEIVVMAQDIMLLEQNNKSNMNIILDKLKQEIKRVNLGKKSLKAYEVPSINTDGIYIDKKK